MRLVVQRVLRASVTVDEEVVGRIGGGLLVLVGVTHDDTSEQAGALARKVFGLRILRDERSISDLIGDHTHPGERPAVLAVSQFTLYGDARKGRRPTWAAAAPRAVAEPIVDAFVAALRDLGVDVQTGMFGAQMRVELINDGPVTLVIDS